MTSVHGDDVDMDADSFAKAMLNILDDAATEKMELANTQRAVLNILEDFASERTRIDLTQSAVLNILEDASEERAGLGDNQRAILNILDDFDAERKNVEAANTELRARTSALSISLKEREILLQEVHHRVKNNLQVISSLINMQVRQLEQGPSRRALEECQRRVQAIALIHEKLYQSQSYTSVPFSEYARTLAGSVFQATGASPTLISLALSIEDLSLPVDKAIPCGLILNELITNSLKHAFADGRAGTVRVELSKSDQSSVRLTVRDDGVGLPPGFGNQPTASLGLQLVRMLVKQLGAKLTIDGTSGASFALSIPVQE